MYPDAKLPLLPYYQFHLQLVYSVYTLSYASMAYIVRIENMSHNPWYLFCLSLCCLICKFLLPLLWLLKWLKVVYDCWFWLTVGGFFTIQSLSCLFLLEFSCWMLFSISWASCMYLYIVNCHWTEHLDEFITCWVLCPNSRIWWDLFWSRGKFFCSLKLYLYRLVPWIRIWVYIMNVSHSLSVVGCLNILFLICV